ncbi:MAG TPA: YggS family pyridoxal phosphate-dependent enzyme [Alphaproteobacteria bacterium]|nr:YggS family pyridoxal phosphate-dependent enzyme [Alphaproteobacteria bacterium]
MANATGAASVDVAANLARVKARIAAAAREGGRAPEGITLVAVTKTHGAERIRPALEAGHRIFGENRVQEAKAKWPELRKAYPGLELHLIGPLQTNKVKEAIALFDMIETVDRPKLAAALAREMAAQGRRPNCLVEVNIGAEPQKSGIAPDDVAAFVAACREDYKLPIVGLMCMPPLAEPPEPFFRRLAELARRSSLPLLSMGMSEDFELAIRAGATYVRVGTAIFGPRES